MRIVEIIEKKRDGHALSSQEIKFWIEGLTNHTVEDYQSSALLMAITLNGMNMEETTALTKAMIASGDTIDLSLIHGLKVDKHSTGGVGDKTSLVISPIVAACGGKVAKMSGRGLGHTGGTLDKLESIPGFDINIENDAFVNQVNDINVAIIGQTGNLVYADKVLYALRDVTGTVQSIPLIAASIMSKKIAGGADAIVLDVKYGEGAFMKTLDDARELARVMISIGNNLGRDVTALLTNMNQPLGFCIGNALEVKEAVETLCGHGPKDLEELCLVACGHMLVHGKQVDSYEAGYQKAKASIEDGSAYKKFLEWIARQGGDTSVFEDLGAFTHAAYTQQVYADSHGFVSDLKALELGMASLHLGAGRTKKDEDIDFKAGIILNKKVGDSVSEGELLGTLYSNEPIESRHIEEFKLAFSYTDNALETPQLIADIVS